MSGPGDLSAAEEEALAAIDTRALVALVEQLVAVPSVGGTVAECEVQHLVAERLRASGLAVDEWRLDLEDLARRPGFPGVEVERSEAWGVVGSYGGADGPRLILNGHTDVVPPGDVGQWRRGRPFTPYQDGGRIVGRGACDMKAGVAAAIVAAEAVAAAGVPLRGGVAVHSVVGEEDGGLGTFATLARGHLGDAVVITEPTRLHLVPAGAGALTFRLTVPGRNAHGSMRTSGVSAVDAFRVVDDALKRLEERRNADVDPLMAAYDVAYPISIGAVAAGEWASTVPDRLTAEGRFGVALGEDVAAARDAFEAAVAAACAADGWLAANPVRVEWSGGQFASGGVAADHPFVGLVAAAHADLHGHRPPVHGVPYGSDLRQYTAAGIPGVLYGPGDVRDAHAPDEHVAVAEVEATARALVLIILRFCGVGAS